MPSGAFTAAADGMGTPEQSWPALVANSRLKAAVADCQWNVRCYFQRRTTTRVNGEYLVNFSRFAFCL
jgi:hypothetical protein